MLLGIFLLDLSLTRLIYFFFLNLQQLSCCCLLIFSVCARVFDGLSRCTAALTVWLWSTLQLWFCLSLPMSHSREEQLESLMHLNVAQTEVWWFRKEMVTKMSGVSWTCELIARLHDWLLFHSEKKSSQGNSCKSLFYFLCIRRDDEAENQWDLQSSFKS